MKAKILAVLTIAFWFGFQTCSYASNVTITSKSDKTSANSLRGAITRANKFGGNNTITLARGTYQLNIQGVDEDAGYTGDLDITKGNLTIVGQPGSRVTIDATDLGDRVFHIGPGAHLTLVNVVITGGYGAYGGGVLNEGMLTLNNCTVSDNSAAAGDNNFNFGTGGIIIITFPVPVPGGNGGNGGGIYNSGTLKLNNSIVTGNSAGAGQDGYGGGNGGGGGGIYNDGNLTLNHCTVSGNSSGTGGDGGTGVPDGYDGGNGGSGGGIFNAGDASQARLINTSTVSNFAGQGGQGGGSFSGAGSDGSPGLDGSGPDLFGDFTISP